MAAKIRKGDKVVVLTGRDKGRTGEVIEVRPAEDRALVRGVNMVKRHQQQTPQQEGGIISKEAPIHLSNLALADPKDGKPTRVGFKFIGEGDDREGALREALRSRDRWLIRRPKPRSRAGQRRRSEGRARSGRAEGRGQARRKARRRRGTGPAEGEGAARAERLHAASASALR